MAQDRKDGGRGRRTAAVNRGGKRGGSGKGATPRGFYTLLLVVAVLGAGGLGWMAKRPKANVRTVDPNLPPAQAEGYLLGRPDAPVQVLEFADFECPACGNFAMISEPDIRRRVIATGLANIRYFDFPLPMHKNTWSASNAAACADDQGKFWEYHDRLFQLQDQWNGEATSRPKGVLKQMARDLGLNVDQWETCFDNQTHLRRIQANEAEAERRGVSETPTFVIGNQMIKGALSADAFKAYVDSARARAVAQASDAAKTTPRAARSP
jgi:protein-disulfide isomerase